MTMVNCYPNKMNLSFSGCGFLCIYHAGVAAAIKEYAPQLIQNKISGASAGAIVAAGLITGVCISEATSTILKVVTQARSRTLGPVHPAFNLLDIVRSEITRTLPADAYRQCNGRLQISLTRWSDCANVIVDEYDSNEELIDAIICSCFIPAYCGMIWLPKYRGVTYIDGGITDNQPVYDDHTVTVSPFSGESDICPQDTDSGSSFFGLSFSNTNIRFTTSNLYRLTCALMPPSTEKCANMCVTGFEDAIRFLTNTGLAPCINCMTLQSDIHITPGKVRIPKVNRGYSPRNAMSPRNRTSSATPKNRKDRQDTERETCCDNSDFMPSLPKILVERFQETFHAEQSYFSFLWEFRLIRWTRTAFGLSKLPWDTFVVISKSLVSSAARMGAPDRLLKQYAAMSQVLLKELGTQKVRYSMYSCQLELTQFDQKRHQVVKEHKGTKFVLNAAAKEELEMLRIKDNKGKKQEESKPSSSRQISPDTDWSGLSNIDSYEHLVEYSKHHDSLYEFHYMDENNIKHSTGMFDMARPHQKHPCHSHHHENVKRPVSMVLEEDEECFAGGSVVSEVPGGGIEDDSGLSGVEQSTIGKRDACCSPVHDFPPVVSTSHRAVPRKSSVRRHPPTAPALVNSLRSMHRDAAVSSDSEVDGGECLFIPDRQVRRASNEYDGEPEPSD